MAGGQREGLGFFSLEKDVIEKGSQAPAVLSAPIRYCGQAGRNGTAQVNFLPGGALCVLFFFFSLPFVHHRGCRQHGSQASSFLPGPGKQCQPRHLLALPTSPLLIPQVEPVAD